MTNIEDRYKQVPCDQCMNLRFRENMIVSDECVFCSLFCRDRWRARNRTERSAREAILEGFVKAREKMDIKFPEMQGGDVGSEKNMSDNAERAAEYVGVEIDSISIGSMRQDPEHPWRFRTSAHKFMFTFRSGFQIGMTATMLKEALFDYHTKKKAVPEAYSVEIRTKVGTPDEFIMFAEDCLVMKFSNLRGVFETVCISIGGLHQAINEWSQKHER